MPYPSNHKQGYATNNIFNRFGFDRPGRSITERSSTFPLNSILSSAAKGLKRSLTFEPGQYNSYNPAARAKSFARGLKGSFIFGQSPTDHATNSPPWDNRPQEIFREPRPYFNPDRRQFTGDDLHNHRSTPLPTDTYHSAFSQRYVHQPDFYQAQNLPPMTIPRKPIPRRVIPRKAVPLPDTCLFTAQNLPQETALPRQAIPRKPVPPSHPCPYKTPTSPHEFTARRPSSADGSMGSSWSSSGSEMDEGGFNDQIQSHYPYQEGAHTHEARIRPSPAVEYRGRTAQWHPDDAGYVWPQSSATVCGARDDSSIYDSTRSYSSLDEDEEPPSPVPGYRNNEERYNTSSGPGMAVPMAGHVPRHRRNSPQRGNEEEVCPMNFSRKYTDPGYFERFFFERNPGGRASPELPWVPTVYANSESPELSPVDDFRNNDDYPPYRNLSSCSASSSDSDRNGSDSPSWPTLGNEWCDGEYPDMGRFVLSPARRCTSPAQVSVLWEANNTCVRYESLTGYSAGSRGARDSARIWDRRNVEQPQRSALLRTDSYCPTTVSGMDEDEFGNCTVFIGEQCKGFWKASPSLMWTGRGR